MVMKTVLKISLILNVGLLASLLFSGANRPGAQIPASISLATKAKTPAPCATSAATTVTSSAKSSRFQWSQLDSSDYHIYVKNLRAIGCPEPTVRAIVTTDVDSIYEIFEDQLEQKLAEAETGSWSNQLSGYSSETALKEALQKLPAEKTAKIADLLGLKPASLPTATMAASAPADSLPVPLVMQNINLSGLNLSEDQKQIIASLRQDFLKQVGSPSQDPNDPAYLARWQKAQPDADNMLEAMLGNDVYTRYQLAAHQLMLESITTPAH